MLKKVYGSFPFRNFAAVAVREKVLRSKKPRQIKKTDDAFIECKRANFNALQFSPSDSKFGTIPLASGGWRSTKSKGDFFIIHPTASEQEVQMVDINTVLENMILSTTLLENLKTNFNITQFTPIQVDGIPKIYDGVHVLIAAETGCGKTLTYLLPIIQKILESKSRNECDADRKLNTPLVLILSPGRELAAQIGDVAKRLCDSTGLKVETILGGNTKQQMVNPNFTEVDILVATIGAISKLVTTGIFRMDQVRHVVLDEADTLLDDSFSEKLGYFLKRFPFHLNQMRNDSEISTQLVLASATMPTNTSTSLKNIIDVSTLHQIVSKNLHRLMPHIQQKFLRTNKQERPGILLSIVKAELAKNRPTIIFSNKSTSCDYISLFLNNSGVKCINLNGDMLMKIRVGRFQQFQDGNVNVLSTTDIGSRGLDTTRARHVINFDFPLYVADYIHRSGRIGRMGTHKKCFVTNLISSQREIDLVQKIEHAARTGGILTNVDANISNIIRTRLMNEMKAAGLGDDLF